MVEVENKLYTALTKHGELTQHEWEALAKKTEHRTLYFLENTPEERYTKFTTEENELCKRLPLKQIAAYLGITDVSLSRIRSRINNR